MRPTKRTANLSRGFRASKSVAELERRFETAAAPLPIAKVWERGDAALRGELFTHRGSTWQCVVERTGQPPGGPHWVCVARGCDTLASSHLPASERVDEANALRAEFVAEIDDLRAETGEKVLALRERVADAIASRSQIDRAIEAAIARARDAAAVANAELRAEVAKAVGGCRLKSARSLHR
jgi:hypothetical protein